MIVIPAVDIKGGRCVRLEQGEADRETVYGDDPAAPAKRWADAGAERIHVVDLDGAFDGRPKNAEAVRAILAAVDVPIEVGGGIRTPEAAAELIEAGAARVVVGTRAAEDPEFLRALANAHPGKINLGLDAKDGYVAVKGWVETGGLRAVDLLNQLADVPLGEVIYTDIARDGMLKGPNFAEMEEVQKESAHPVIASGGVTTEDDIRRLADMGVFGAIVGKALYDGRLSIEDALAAAKSR